MEWQPIETAPKDGTRVFLWLPKIEGVQHEKRIESAWSCWNCWGNEYGNGPAYNVVWVQGKYSKEPKHEHIQPTHWMPLPEAPNATELTGAEGVRVE